MLQSEADNFRAFIANFPQLKDNFKALIDSHYSFDIFDSERAKVQYLESDLSPF